MIRGVIVHLTGEQPFIADIETMPAAGDTALICTNIRLGSGKRPNYIDRGDSWFIFPLAEIHFIEVPAAALEGVDAPRLGAGEEPQPEPELELDEDFLRRIREA